MQIPLYFAMQWSRFILDFNFGLTTKTALPVGISYLYPYDQPETRRCMQEFFDKYFSDTRRRTLLLGINPGRFGAGITGVPFTDPIRLEDICGVENTFKKRQELSSLFVYDFIDALGGPEVFYSKFYITSLCPLGFLKDGKNYNYYDDRALQSTVMPLILKNIRAHLDTGANPEIAFSIGRGKNFKVLQQINQEHGYFGQVIPLPHPRWVMQYRLKRKLEFVQEYVSQLQSISE